MFTPFLFIQMKVNVRKITDLQDAKDMISASIMGGMESSLKGFKKLYASEHSPMYSQIYVLDLEVPYFVSTHIRTHKKHFITEVVSSNRKDRNGGKDADRNTMVRMIIYCNAKTLVDMCRRRLCYHASTETKEVFQRIKGILAQNGDELAEFLVKPCVYRNGLCAEFSCCGYVHTGTYIAEQKRYNENFKLSKSIRYGE